jgi:hypothetical protein
MDKKVDDLEALTQRYSLKIKKLKASLEEKNHKIHFLDKLLM